MECCCRFLRLDDLESFLEDAERTAATEDDDKQDVDAEDRLGEGLHHAWHVALSCCAAGCMASDLFVACSGACY